MNAVIERIKREDATQLGIDQARYAEIIFDGEPDAVELKELRVLMDRLCKSAEDLQRDHNTIREALHAEAIIADGAGLEEKIIAGLKARNEYRAETDRIAMERAKEDRRLQREYDDLQSRAGAARSQQHQFKGLVNQHPELLGHRHSKLLHKPFDPNQSIPGGVASDLR